MVWKVIDFSHLIKNIMVTPEFHSEPSQTSKVELFAKTVNGSELLIVFARSSILDDWSGSEYACFVHKKEHFISVSFKKKNIDGVNKESGYLVMLPYAFPQSVLHFLRSIVPGDIKGEIREVWIQIDRLPSGNSIFFPCASDLRILNFFATKCNRSRKTFLKYKAILYLYVSLADKFKLN